jgi:hypothetical protein
MRKFIFIFLIFISHACSAQWNLIYTSSGGSTVADLSYTNDSVVAIATFNKFYFSTDNGASFSSTAASSMPCMGSGYNIYGVTAFNASDIRLTGFNNTYGTTNVKIPGVITSSTCHSVTTSYSGVAGVSYHNNLGFVLLNNAKLYKSTDAGVFWSMITDLAPVTDPLDDLFFADDTTGFFFGKNGSVRTTYRTDNGGIYANPVNVFTDTYNNYVASCFTDKLTGYLILNDASGYSRLYKTTTSGNSWSTVFPGDLNYTLNDVYFTSTDTGYLCGKGLIMMTTDGGVTWGIQKFYSGENFKKIKTVNNRGLVVGYKGSTMIVYQTTNYGGIYKPFSYYYLGYPSCCDGIACSITNNGDFSSSYSWYVDGTLVSSTFSIAPVTYSGTHTVTLVRHTGALIDTFKRSIYFAPVLPGSYSISSTMDTTLCPTQDISVNISPTYTNFTYSIWLDGSQIGPSSLASGTGSITINTLYNPLANDTITIHAASPYYYCPGNLLTKNRTFTIYPNTAVIPITLSTDTVCPNGICIASLATTVSAGEYSFYLEAGTYSTTGAPFTGTGSSYLFPASTLYGSGYYYYKIHDTYGCTNYSDSVPIIIDTVDVILYSPSYMCHVNDTMTIQNLSPGSGFTWVFPPGSIVIDSSSEKYRTVIFTANIGRDSIILYQKGYTGTCIATGYFPVFVYDDPPLPTGIICKKQELTVPSYNLPISCGGYDRQIFAHHIDSHSNTYIGVWENVLYFSSWRIKGTIYKYDSSGNFLWSVPCLSESKTFKQISFSGIATDSHDNVYVTGFFTCKDYIYIGNDTVHIGTPPLPSRYFLMKLDSTGNMLWMDYSSADNMSGDVYKMASGPMVVSDTSIFVIFPLIDSLINDHHVHLFGSASYSYGAFEFDTSGNFKSLITIEPTGSNNFDDPCAGSGNRTFLDPKFDIYFDKIIVSGLRRAPLPEPPENYTSYLRTCATNGTMLSTISDLKLKLGPPEPYDYGGFPLDHILGPTDIALHSAFSVSPSGSIYNGYNFYSNNMLYELCIDYGNYYLETGSGDKINYPLHGSAYQKHTIGGTLQYTLYFPGVKIQNLVANRDGYIYGIGNWTRLCGLPSNDGHNGGYADTSRYINSVFFCYDTLGNLKWAQNIAGNEVDLARSLIRQNPCDNNLYFLMGSNTDYVFMGDTNTNHAFLTQYVYSPDASCATTPPIACSWGYSTNIKGSAKNNSSVSVFPNPFNSQFQIVSKNLGLATVRIVDVAGKVILSKSTSGSLETTIDLTAYQDGIYFVVVIKTDNSMETVLIEKQ